EALEERGLGLVEVGQLLLDESVAMGGVGDQILIDVAVAEPLGQQLTDLRSTGAHLVGHDDDGHTPHSLLYFAFSAAGAMAMRLPLTSSRTYTSSASVPLAKTSNTSRASSSVVPRGRSSMSRSTTSRLSLNPRPSLFPWAWRDSGEWAWRDSGEWAWRDSGE